jgi:hypothetical protein
MTALMRVSGQGHTARALVLIGAGADLNLQDKVSNQIIVAMRAIQHSQLLCMLCCVDAVNVAVATNYD